MEEKKSSSKQKMNYRPSMCSICREKFLPTPATRTNKCFRCQHVLHQSDPASAGIYFREGSLGEKLGMSTSKMSRKFTESFKSLNTTPPAWADQTGVQPVTDTKLQPARKRALLCGVTYKKEKHKLNGTFNDVKNFRDLLIDTFQFRSENILVLSEEEQEQTLKPTRYNILRALKWLVEGCKSGDSLVFYFSGHGLRQPDFSDDEQDGFDETICPVDFMEAGMILDNDINRLIVSPLEKGATLHAIVDACHSGTILDLEHVYDRQKEKWMDNRPRSGKFKSTKGGLAISISACDDSEFAADTSKFSGNRMNGAMTYLLVEAIRKGSKISFGDLIDTIYQKIEHVNRTRCLGNVIPLRLGKKILQKPQLSSSKPFEVYNKIFEL